MSDDLIRRKDAIDEFWQLDIEIRPSAIDAITKMLMNLPSTQPQQTCEYWDSESKFCTLCRPSAQKEGWWIEADDLDGAMKGRVFCSNCKNPFDCIVMTNDAIILTNQKTKYCPNCGAKMKGEINHD